MSTETILNKLLGTGAVLSLALLLFLVCRSWNTATRETHDLLHVQASTEQLEAAAISQNPQSFSRSREPPNPYRPAGGNAYCMDLLEVIDHLESAVLESGIGDSNSQLPVSETALSQNEVERIVNLLCRKRDWHTTEIATKNNATTISPPSPTCAYRLSLRFDTDRKDIILISTDGHIANSMVVTPGINYSTRRTDGLKMTGGACLIGDDDDDQLCDLLVALTSREGTTTGAN